MGVSKVLAATVAIIAALATAPTALAEDFAGPIDIGNGRSLYLDCQGGAPPGSPHPQSPAAPASSRSPFNAPAISRPAALPSRIA